jgi:hypothetical protein
MDDDLRELSDRATAELGGSLDEQVVRATTDMISDYCMQERGQRERADGIKMMYLQS